MRDGTRHTLVMITRAMTVAAAGWCVAAGLWLWFRPLAYRRFPSADPAGTVVHRSFAEVSQYGPIPLVVPIALAIIAATAAWRGLRVTYVCFTLLIAAFTVLAGFSIGAAYVPASLLFMVATIPVLLLGPSARQQQRA